MLLPDHQIRNYNIFTPFIESSGQVQPGKMGTGLGSYGYDLSLSDREFKIYRDLKRHNDEINPKDFNQDYLEEIELKTDKWGKYFVLPKYSYGLGCSVEYIDMPDNITGIAIGKSTYARIGIIANITPIECGWKGYLTLEFANTSPNNVRIYANEGVVQILLFSSIEPEKTYSDKGGKYNYQPEEITTPKVNKRKIINEKIKRGIQQLLGSNSIL